MQCSITLDIFHHYVAAMLDYLTDIPYSYSKWKHVGIITGASYAESAEQKDLLCLTKLSPKKADPVKLAIK